MCAWDGKERPDEGVSMCVGVCVGACLACQGRMGEVRRIIGEGLDEGRKGGGIVEFLDLLRLLQQLRRLHHQQ